METSHSLRCRDEIGSSLLRVSFLDTFRIVSFGLEQPSVRPLAHVGLSSERQTVVALYVD